MHNSWGFGGLSVAKLINSEDITLHRGMNYFPRISLSIDHNEKPLILMRFKFLTASMKMTVFGDIALIMETVSTSET
jgi:hypothetical protein